MRVPIRGVVSLASLALAVGMLAVMAQERTIDDFFKAFSDEWVRADPDLAAATRYFSGAEQDQFERELTPRTQEWRQQRVQLARRGLERLRQFDRESMNDTQRVSADVMRWLLEMVVEGEPYSDYRFPFDQFAGINVLLPNTFTVVHVVGSQRDAENYVARLGQVAARVGEGMTETERLAGE